MNYEKLRSLPISVWTAKAFHSAFHPLNLKGKMEMFYWRLKKLEEGQLNHGHYQEFFTSYFGLSKEDYTGKNILDIGCGPRGSLIWASMARERIGLDPLAKKYHALKGSFEGMRMIEGKSESIPFSTGHFDIVSSFNSLDHVDDLDQTISEIHRVIKPGGYFLLITDIHENPTITEPIAFSWNISEKFDGGFDKISERHYEGHRLYKSIRENRPFDHSNPEKRYGILTALFQRK